MSITAFRKRLREFDKSLSVRVRPRGQGFQILQNRPRTKYYGVWNGAQIARVEDWHVHVAYVPDITDRVFEVLRHSNTARYRNFDEFCREFKLPTA